MKSNRYFRQWYLIKGSGWLQKNKSRFSLLSLFLVNIGQCNRQILAIALVSLYANRFVNSLRVMSKFILKSVWVAYSLSRWKFTVLVCSNKWNKNRLKRKSNNQGENYYKLSMRLKKKVQSRTKNQIRRSPNLILIKRGVSLVDLSHQGMTKEVVKRSKR